MESFGEESEEDKYRTTVDNTVFLIDASPEMWELNTQHPAECHVINILKLALEMMKSRVIQSTKDSIGIVLYSTLNQEPKDGAPNVYILQKLQRPSEHSIKALQKAIDGGTENLQDLLGVGILPMGVSVPLKEAIWTASRLFMCTNKHNRFDERQIWLFTNDDHPNSYDSEVQRHQKQVISDAKESGTKLSLWYLDKEDENKKFDINKFYKTAFALDTENDIHERATYAGRQGFNPKSARVRMKTTIKRSLGTVPFYFGGEGEDPSNIKMVVQIFKLISDAKKPTQYLFDQDTNKSVYMRSRYLHPTTADVLTSVQMRHYINSATESLESRMYIDKEKITEIKKAGSKSANIRLLYCAEASTLGVLDNMGTPLFLFPHEESCKGSSTIFAAFLNSLYKKKLIAVASMMRTKSSSPRLVAMLPQMEILHSDGYQEQPSGFNIIPLPYSNEFRCSPQAASDVTISVPSSDAINNATTILEKLKLIDDKKYFDIPNPSLQCFYAGLQSIVLTEEHIEEWEDELKPNVPHVDEAMDFIISVGGTNRKADDEEINIKKTATKRPVEERQMTATTHEIDEWKNGNLSELNLNELKVICGKLNLTKSAKNKQVIVDRIMEKLSDL